MRYTAFFILFLLSFIFICGCPPAAVQPVEPGVIGENEKTSFNDEFADILKNYVDENGMVDYKALKRNRRELNDLLLKCRRLNRAEYNSWPLEEKKAFWLNVYNVELLGIIADNYPIDAIRIFMLFWPPDSIRHIDKRIGGIDRQKFMVMEEEFTLRGIEDSIFREGFAQPVLFIGLSRATVSGPFLRNEPYVGRRLYEQLDEQARKFFAGPGAFRTDREKKIVYLSAIFRPKWFGNEFVSKYNTDRKFKDLEKVQRSVLNFASGYINPEQLDFIELENYSVQYIDYDWRLNDRHFK